MVHINLLHINFLPLLRCDLYRCAAHNLLFNLLGARALLLYFVGGDFPLDADLSELVVLFGHGAQPGVLDVSVCRFPRFFLNLQFGCVFLLNCSAFHRIVLKHLQLLLSPRFQCVFTRNVSAPLRNASYGCTFWYLFLLLIK